MSSHGTTENKAQPLAGAVLGYLFEMPAEVQVVCRALRLLGHPLGPRTLPRRMDDMDDVDSKDSRWGKFIRPAGRDGGQAAHQHLSAETNV